MATTNDRAREVHGEWVVDGVNGSGGGGTAGAKDGKTLDDFRGPLSEGSRVGLMESPCPATKVLYLTFDP